MYSDIDGSTAKSYDNRVHMQENTNDAGSNSKVRRSSRKRHLAVDEFYTEGHRLQRIQDEEREQEKLVKQAQKRIKSLSRKEKCSNSVQDMIRKRQAACEARITDIDMEIKKFKEEGGIKSLPSPSKIGISKKVSNRKRSGLTKEQDHIIATVESLCRDDIEIPEVHPGICNVFHSDCERDFENKSIFGLQGDLQEFFHTMIAQSCETSDSKLCSAFAKAILKVDEHHHNQLFLASMLGSTPGAQKIRLLIATIMWKKFCSLDAENNLFGSDSSLISVAMSYNGEIMNKLYHFRSCFLMLFFCVCRDECISRLDQKNKYLKQLKKKCSEWKSKINDKQGVKLGPARIKNWILFFEDNIDNMTPTNIFSDTIFQSSMTVDTALSTMKWVAEARLEDKKCEFRVLIVKYRSTRVKMRWVDIHRTFGWAPNEMPLLGFIQFQLIAAVGHGHVTLPASTRNGGSLAKGGDCRNGACFWFSNNVEIPGKPTLPKQFWSVNNNVTEGAPNDLFATSPWRAPGSAPVYGSGCGSAGGGPVAYLNGG
eukprot:UC4_evm9s607